MKGLYPWQHELWQRWAGLRKRLPHAILLKGAQGIGKLDFAMNLAQSLLCEQPHVDGMACGACSSCHWFEQETHPDFRLLQPDALSGTEDDDERDGSKKKKPSRQISVEQVRSLFDFANLSAYRGGHRVVLIHPAEAMNTNAANALLKTLEEPSGKMLIILVSHKPQQLLPTILSRCLSLVVTMPSVEESTAWLQQQGMQNPGVMLAQAGFAPLAAAHLAEEVTAADEYGRFLQEIRQPTKLDALALAEQLQKAEPIKVVHWLQQWCYDLGSAKLAGKIRYNAELTDTIKNISCKIDIMDLQRYQRELLIAKREALHPLNPKLQLESILLAYRQMMLAAS
ncbi:MAG: DNA polymerase III subunit delta' [Nitrosomonadales bacterium]|nr:DNA polymerase III subunit delta' [Nitrosomonadales bacterium]